MIPTLKDAMIAGRRSRENREPEARTGRGTAPTFPDFLVLVHIIDSVSISDNRWTYTARESWIKADNTYEDRPGYRTFDFTNPAEAANTASVIHPGTVNATDFPGTYDLKALSGYGFITPMRGADGSLKWAWVCGASNVDGNCTGG